MQYFYAFNLADPPLFLNHQLSTEMGASMYDLYLRAALGGLFFGLWPLFMNRSHLNGYVSSACFSMATLVGVLPFALASNGFTVPAADWKMVALAGLFGALGLLFFNSMLARVSPQNVGVMFVIMNLMQLAVIAAYQAWASGGMPTHRIVGYAAAAFATFLLVR